VLPWQRKEISVKSVVFVTILALCCYTFCSNCSNCLNACNPLTSGDLASLRRVSATQRKCFTLFACTSVCFKCESHIYNKYVISDVRICNKHWKTKTKVHTKYVKLAFLLMTPCWIAVVNHSKPSAKWFGRFHQTGCCCCSFG